MQHMRSPFQHGGRSPVLLIGLVVGRRRLESIAPFQPLHVGEAVVERAAAVFLFRWNATENAAQFRTIVHMDSTDRQADTSDPRCADHSPATPPYVS